jgi:hypothetical protein
MRGDKSGSPGSRPSHAKCGERLRERSGTGACCAGTLERPSGSTLREADAFRPGEAAATAAASPGPTLSQYTLTLSTEVYARQYQSSPG